MISVSEFSHLVSGIFAAAVSAEPWDAAITEISAAFEDPTGRTGHVLGTKLLDANGLCRTVTGTANPEADISYRDYYGPLDHVMQAVECGPVGVVRTGTELIAPHTGCEFYADWIRPNDLEEGLFVRLTGHANPTSFVVAGSKRSQSFDSADRVTLMAELVPHLQQALCAHDQLSALTRRNGDLADALNMLPHGIIVVGTGLRILECNTAAENLLAEGQALRMSAGCLAASARHAQQRLQQLVHSAIAGDGSGVRSGGALACDRPAPHGPYVLHVLPIDRRTVGVVTPGPTALVVVVDADRDPFPEAPILRQLYDLTTAEATVARLLAHGRCPTAIADQLSLSPTTVKTHLRAIFDKTGTHRQAELVAHLLSATP
jgi:DNA-binding CsgD family transcriptional regulator/PAS domain-containing protein